MLVYKFVLVHDAGSSLAVMLFVLTARVREIVCSRQPLFWFIILFFGEESEAKEDEQT